MRDAILKIRILYRVLLRRDDHTRLICYAAGGKVMNIDSDKLLEWVSKRRPQPARSGCELARETLLQELWGAIHSGELAAKRVYAKAPDGFVGSGVIRGGNIFEVYNDDEIGFNFKVDDGCHYANWRSSTHLGGRDWERVEK